MIRNSAGPIIVGTAVTINASTTHRTLSNCAHIIIFVLQFIIVSLYCVHYSLFLQLSSQNLNRVTKARTTCLGAGRRGTSLASGPSESPVKSGNKGSFQVQPTWLTKGGGLVLIIVIIDSSRLETITFLGHIPLQI